MLYFTLGWLSVLYYCVLSMLLLYKRSDGFKSYVTHGWDSRSSTSRILNIRRSSSLWILYEKNNEHNINKEENNLNAQQDDLIYTKHQQHHHHLHTKDHANDGASSHKSSLSMTQSFSSSAINNNTSSSLSHFIPEDQINTILKFGSGETQKIVNEFGLWCFAMTAISCPPWAAVMSLVDMVCNFQENLDPHRKVFDYTGKIWSRSYLGLIYSYPAISGDVEWVKNNKGKACLYVANHASWIDIPIVCTVLDPVFKFIAKAELKGVPCIGQQLVGGKHILIDRDDRRSQFRAFKEGVNWLKNGVPVMAFPEGQRSKDGRLSDFKGGIFSMAVKAKVPIVPISISNAHAIMPTYSLMPVQSGANKLSVHIHTAIDTTEEGLTEKELSKRVFNAIASKLPEDQRPLNQI